MSRYGQTIENGLKLCKEIIEKDLSEKLNTPVSVSFLDNNCEKISIFTKYKNIMDFVDERTLQVEKFKEAPELIEVEETPQINEYYLTFDSLRSNCRVTHQPDFGDAFIYYKSQKHIREDSLVKYLSSFRSEFHFHEECCEMIYKRLFDILNADDELAVCALYTRRGGIDICPVRYSKLSSDIEILINIDLYARNGIKQ